MTKRLGSELPPELFDLLGPGDPTEHTGFTVLLSTTTPACDPHLALLSLGEVLAIDPGRIRLALWPGSTASVNLSPPGSIGLLTAIEYGSVWGVHFKSRFSRELPVPMFQPVTMIDAAVDEVRSDAVAYAVVETGVRFRLRDASAVIPRWRATRQALADASLAPS